MTTKADYVRAAPDTGNHTCHWPGCTERCRPAMFSCRRHWFTWPQHIRSAIWQAYVPGQEITKTPSTAYIKAAAAAEQWALQYERAKTEVPPEQGKLL
jgi:hypothetical protein